VSTEEMHMGQISADRAIQMLSEASRDKSFLYRTLFGNKNLPHVVYQIEHLTLLFPVVNANRRKSLENFYDVHKNTLISTTSIDGKTMNLLTETRIKHTTEGAQAKKGGFFGNQQ
jgi:hypothetical protein